MNFIKSILFPDNERYELATFIYLRVLGLVYICVFLPLFFQYQGLLGESGLLPLKNYYPTEWTWEQFWRSPSLFWFSQKDLFVISLIQVGLGLSLLVSFGFSHPLILFILWVLQLSFVHGGQSFWGFGWESNLLEVGFLSLFMNDKGKNYKIIMILHRWVLFRLMFGAGLIKLRGDSCWIDLSCMNFHFETQPIPNPLSSLFHFLPDFMLKTMVVVNHIVELIFPFLLFLGRRLVFIAGMVFLLFQFGIAITGNYAWINFLTILMIIPCFEDRYLQKLTPNFLQDYINVRFKKESSTIRNIILLTLALFVSYKSINPIKNLVGPRQAMNRSYDQFHFVNSYGVFGGITKKRMEIVIKGTEDEVIDENTVWKEYEIFCKPGNIFDRPCIASPYHYRLTWQIWFAAMGSYNYNPWIINMVYKLLRGDSHVLSLFSFNPFPSKPPKFIKLDHYLYKLSPYTQQQWYNRTFVKDYLGPVSLEHKGLQDYINKKGWH
ncbi:MAG: lipase maturation factor family protein [Bacteriovoracaceae bacterium]